VLLKSKVIIKLITLTFIDNVHSLSYSGILPSVAALGVN